MIHVYYAPPSIYGRKVLAVLEEKGLDYEIKKMSFSAKDHCKEDYLKLNPNGEIPTLTDDSFVVYESTAIIEYLNDEYPEPALMPADSEGRARVRMIDDFCDLHFYKSIIKILIKKLNKEEVLEEDRARLAKDVKRLEAYLGDQEFIAGEFSLADCAVMSGVASMEGLGIADLLASKKIKDYVARLKRRAGYRGAAMITLEEKAPTV